MLANVSLPSYVIIRVKCWHDILYVWLGVLTEKVTANTTQNSLSDSKSAKLYVCVFDEPSRRCSQAVAGRVEIEAGTF